MAGKVDVVDKKFFDQEIAPHIDGKQIEFLGELNPTTKKLNYWEMQQLPYSPSPGANLLVW